MIILTVFGYMYGTCTFFFPTCADQVQINLPYLPPTPSPRYYESSSLIQRVHGAKQQLAEKLSEASLAVKDI